MDITKTTAGDALDVVVSGRVDGYWADHLDQALAEAVHEEHYRIRLNCSGIAFLSSAGIAVLVKYHKELARLGGTFWVVSPSAQVAAVLRMTRLSQLLVEPAGSAAPAPPRTPAQRLERNGATFEVYPLDSKARLVCRAIGQPVPLLTSAFDETHCASLGSTAPAFAMGVGAFGAVFGDCRPRFGELLSVAGATACQPADGTDVPDYLLASGALANDVRVLYCLAAEGGFSHFVRFEMAHEHDTIGLAELLAGCFEVANTPAIGVIVMAETTGLVGGALRRSPASPIDGQDFFAHPGVRSRLSFTAEPAYPGSVALAAGVAAQSTAETNSHDQLRPMGSAARGHFHAAAFRFRAMRKGTLELAEAVAGLFEADRLLGVMHLLHDDRGAAGAGDSEFVRGACWIAPCSF